MAINDIVQTVADARVDARSLSEFVFKPASFMVARRLAPSVHTLQYYVNRFETIDSSFTQALNTANAAAVTATNNAVGLIDSVTNNAYNQVSSAIDGVAINANLVTDALVTTSIRKSGQVVRTQADKNSDIINGKDFGIVADGVTDNYPAFENMFAILTGSQQGTYQPKATIELPEGVIYCSETLSLKGTIILRGKSTGLTGAINTVIEFAEGKDGIVVNRDNTDGVYGTVPKTIGADGTLIEGIAIRQRGFNSASAPVFDYNASDSNFITNQRGRLYESDEIIRTFDNAMDQKATATVVSSSVVNTTLVPSVPLSPVLGTVITGQTSGAVGTVLYVGTQTVAIALNNVTGTFAVGEDLIVEGKTAKVVSIHAYPFTVHKVKDVSGSIEEFDVFTPASTSGSGIILRARAIVKNCHISSFPHVGLYVKTGGSSPTNANLFNVDTVDIRVTGLHGMLTWGGDANAGRVTAVNASGIGGYGIKDASFLGNHYYSCHVSVCFTGAYHSSIHNNFSVFLGCYSEGMHQTQPFFVSSSRIGRDTTVIGGTHGAGVLPNGVGGSYLNGRNFNVSKAINLLGDVSTEGTITNTTRFTGSANRPKPITISMGGNSGHGQGPGIGFRLPYGGPRAEILDDMSDTVDGGALRVIRGRYLGSELAIELSTLSGTTNSSIDITGGGATSNARVYPIVEGGTVVELKIAYSGAGYTSTPTVTGSGVYTGLTAETEIFNGEVVSFKITDGLTGLTDTKPVDQLVISSDYIKPSFDNKMTLGLSGNRFSDIYSVNAVISTSDAREKTRPVALDDTVLDAWGSVSYITFQWIDSVTTKGDDARKHVGVIAQQIYEAFESKSLDAFEYGLLCYDINPEQVAEFDEDGKQIVEYKPATDSWAIRADQCLFMEAAYQRRENSRIIERLEVLEAK